MADSTGNNGERNPMCGDLADGVYCDDGGPLITTSTDVDIQLEGVYPSKNTALRDTGTGHRKKRYSSDAPARWRDISGSQLAVQSLEKLANLDVGYLTAETCVTTSTGNVPIGSLKIGDIMLTADNGFKEIKWIASQTMSGFGRMAPILIEANALNNLCDMLVSPHHNMVISGPQNELWFDYCETLIPAKFLINGSTIRQVNANNLTYVNVVLDQHEIIFAEGAATASFYPDSHSISTLDHEAREELYRIFPELRNQKGVEASNQLARRVLTQREARFLMSQSVKTAHKKVKISEGGGGYSRGDPSW